MKKLILIVAILSGCATTDKNLNCAVNAQVGDAISTGLTISTGQAAELNPLGVAGSLIAKPLLISRINRMEEPKRSAYLRAATIYGNTATAHNICVLVSITGNLGLSAPACFLAFGIPVGIWTYKNPCE